MTGTDAIWRAVPPKNLIGRFVWRKRGQWSLGEADVFARTRICLLHARSTRPAGLGLKIFTLPTNPRPVGWVLQMDER